MFEESSSEVASSMWASINSWFTPAVPFVLLNLMIATIALTSALPKKKPNQNQPPKTLLHRLRSTNFYPHFSTSHIYKHGPESDRISPAHLVSGEKDSILGDFEESEPAESMDEVFSRLAGGHFVRTKSDTVPASGETPANLPANMKKSAFGHCEEEKIVEARRPATVREARGTDGDVEVDAKADDFINRFKQQMRVQRLDSIVRYKDLIGRVTGGM